MKGVEIIETIHANGDLRTAMILFIICVFFWISAILFIKYSQSIIGMIMAVIFAIIAALFTISITQMHGERYKIKIHDNASYNEFTSKYNIIEKHGNTYIVEEKE